MISFRFVHLPKPGVEVEVDDLLGIGHVGTEMVAKQGLQIRGTVAAEEQAAREVILADGQARLQRRQAVPHDQPPRLEQKLSYGLGTRSGSNWR